jgi:catechol 2,3-dioxygenase-like lactoylglutathione lyase family enzyme
MNLIELAYFTDNVEEMASFYRHLLGKESVVQSEDMAIFMSGQTKIFIHWSYPAGEGDLPPDNHIAFAVENVDQVCKQLVEEGLKLEVPPQDYYWGRSAYLRDPDGQQIELTQLESDTG